MYLHFGFVKYSREKGIISSQIDMKHEAENVVTRYEVTKSSLKIVKNFKFENRLLSKISAESFSVPTASVVIFTIFTPK
jgi:hypothetical protein